MDNERNATESVDWRAFAEEQLDVSRKEKSGFSSSSSRMLQRAVRQLALNYNTY